MNTKPNRKTKMEYHEYANIYRMLPDKELQTLAADIKSKGQLLPITSYEGKILDGRNRFRACGIAGLQPRFTEYTGDDPLGFVMSHNLHRRHLTESQRAMVAAKWAKLKNGEIGNGRKVGSPIGEPTPPIQSETKTRDEAAKLLNIGTSSIDRAKKVIKDAPELVEKIEAGEMSVNAAYVATKKPNDDSNSDCVYSSEDEEPKPEPGVALVYARTAINALNMIPKKDPSRKAAIDMIAEWISRNTQTKTKK